MKISLQSDYDDPFSSMYDLMWRNMLKMYIICEGDMDQSAVYFYPGHLATYACPVWKLSRDDDVKILKLINLFWFGRVR